MRRPAKWNRAQVFYHRYHDKEICLAISFVSWKECNLGGPTNKGQKYTRAASASQVMFRVKSSAIMHPLSVANGYSAVTCALHYVLEQIDTTDNCWTFEAQRLFPIANATIHHRATIQNDHEKGVRNLIIKTSRTATSIILSYIIPLKRKVELTLLWIFMERW